MLRVEGLSAAYGPIRALHRVSLTVDAGAVVCLLGANGAGKTTTLNCISGVVPVQEGRIFFGDEEITRLQPEDVVARGLVQVPEGREIFPELSVVDNLRLGSWCRRWERNSLALLDRVYDYFPRLQERRDQFAGTLSGGEQQMLMIGRALMARPKVIMLDEPSLGLSPLLVQSLFAILARMNQDGLTILLVEQNARLALRSSSYGYILENGEIRLHGASRDLRDNREVIAAYLGG
jgi:branched-chain amino acid transport system ATP-binding protein